MDPLGLSEAQAEAIGHRRQIGHGIDPDAFHFSGVVGVHGAGRRAVGVPEQVLPARTEFAVAYEQPSGRKDPRCFRQGVAEPRVVYHAAGADHAVENAIRKRQLRDRRVHGPVQPRDATRRNIYVDDQGPGEPVFVVPGAGIEDQGTSRFSGKARPYGGLDPGVDPDVHGIMPTVFGLPDDVPIVVDPPDVLRRDAAIHR